MPNYQNGKVYKIVNTENAILYIGSTCQQLSQRMGTHRSRAKAGTTAPVYKAMRDIGVGKFSIVLVKDVSCFNKTQLEKQEFKVMADCKVRGIQLYNFCTTPERLGPGNSNFKRGCVSRYANTGTNYPQWVFSFRENGQVITKTFSIHKNGEEGAKALAIAAQNKQYPLPIDHPTTPEYKVNKAYVEMRVSQKMGEIKSKLDYIQDLGTLESQAADALRDHYDALIMSHYKRLEKYKGTVNEIKIRHHIQVIQYAQIVAQRYAVHIEYSPE